MSNKKMVQQARQLTSTPQTKTKTRTDGVDILPLSPSINNIIYLQLSTTYSIQTCALLIFRPNGREMYLQYRLWSQLSIIIINKQLLSLIKNVLGILGYGCIYACV